jgi:hypothetical protein
MSYDLPAPGSLAWSYLTEPGLRAGWTPGVQRIDQSTPDGRRATETRNHCVHGKNVLLEEILERRAFDDYTMDVTRPVPLLKPFRVTYELEDTPEGPGHRVLRPRSRVRTAALLLDNDADDGRPHATGRGGASLGAA